MASLKFHARTTLRDIQQAFGGPGKFALRASHDGELRAHGKYTWSRDDMLARLGDVGAQERLEQSGERAIGLIRKAIDNEFGQGVGSRAFSRAEEKRRDRSVSLADLRSAACEVAPELARQLMGASCVSLLTETFDTCGIERDRLKDAAGFVQAMSKAVLDLQASPLRDLGHDDFRRAAQGALLALLRR